MINLYFFCGMSPHVLESSPNLAWPGVEQSKNLFAKNFTFLAQAVPEVWPF